MVLTQTVLWGPHSEVRAPVQVAVPNALPQLTSSISKLARLSRWKQAVVPLLAFRSGPCKPSKPFKSPQVLKKLAFCSLGFCASSACGWQKVLYLAMEHLDKGPAGLRGSWAEEGGLRHPVHAPAPVPFAGLF